MSETANIDWANLPFGYMPSDYNVRVYYRNGKWGEIEVSSSDTINIHMAATCLHYGQEASKDSKPSDAQMAKCAFSVWKRTPSASKIPAAV